MYRCFFYVVVYVYLEQEMVVDRVGSHAIPRYLIYDVVVFQVSLISLPSSILVMFPLFSTSNE